MKKKILKRGYEKVYTFSFDDWIKEIFEQKYKNINKLLRNAIMWLIDFGFHVQCNSITMKFGWKCDYTKLIIC